MFDQVSLGTALALRDVLLSDEPAQDKMKILQRVEVNTASSIPSILRAKEFESVLGEREAQRLRTAFAQSIGPSFKSSPLVHARDTIHTVDEMLNRILSGVEIEDAEWDSLDRHRIKLPKFSASFSSILMENEELRIVHLNNVRRLEIVFDRTFKRPGKSPQAEKVEQEAPDIDNAHKSIMGLGAGGFGTEKRGILSRRGAMVQLPGAPSSEPQGKVEVASEPVSENPVENNTPAVAAEETAPPASEEIVNRYEDEEPQVAEETTPQSSSGDVPAQTVETPVDKSAVEEGATGLKVEDLSDEEKARLSSALVEAGYEGVLDGEEPPFSSQHKEGSRGYRGDLMAFEELLLKRKRAMFVCDGVLEEIAEERAKVEQAEAEAQASSSEASEQAASGNAEEPADKEQAEKLSKALEDLEGTKVELASSRQEAEGLRKEVSEHAEEAKGLRESMTDLQAELALLKEDSSTETLNARIAELEQELKERPAFDGKYRNRVATLLTEEMAKDMLKSVPAVPEEISGVAIPYVRVLMLRSVVRSMRVGMVAEDALVAEAALVEEDAENARVPLRNFLLKASIAVLDEKVERSNAAVFEAAMQSLGLPLDADIDEIEDADVISFLKFFQNANDGTGAGGLGIFVDDLAQMQQAVQGMQRLSALGIDDVEVHIKNFRQLNAELTSAQGEVASLTKTVENLSKADGSGRAAPVPAPAPSKPISPSFLSSLEVSGLLARSGASYLRPGILEMDGLVFYIQSDNDDDAIDRGGGISVDFEKAFHEDIEVLNENGITDFCIISKGDPQVFQRIVRTDLPRASFDSVSPSEDAILKLMRELKRRADKA